MLREQMRIVAMAALMCVSLDVAAGVGKLQHRPHGFRNL